MSHHRIELIGADLATGALGLAARTEDGGEHFAEVPMRGQALRQGQPAFDLQLLPGILLEGLTQLESRGLTASEAPGAISFDVRQHELVLLGEKGQLLGPALIWKCDAASVQVQKLREAGMEALVGRIEERLILPKLWWLLGLEPELRGQIRWVMSLADWVAFMLVGGKPRLCTSEALSNGLLEQKTKQLAVAALKCADLKPEWFPEVIPSGSVQGRASEGSVPGSTSDWDLLRKKLAGWQVVAGLGDNHSSAVGCGLAPGNYHTIVNSMGNSGTVLRICPAQAATAGEAAKFDFYDDRLLLMMIHECSSSYDEFVGGFAPGYQKQLGSLDALVLEADPAVLRRIVQKSGRDVLYPPQFASMRPHEQVACKQFSLVLDMLLLTKAMLAEIQDPPDQIDTFVLTGGVSQSKFVQQVFACGAALLAPGARAMISAVSGPMRYETAARGALLNAELPSRKDLAALVAERCPLAPCATADPRAEHHLRYLLRSYGL